MAGFPWRAPDPGRPEVPLPPERMPLSRHGRMRKRWRYVAAFGPRMMVCAGRVEVGPLGQSFWALWDRERERLRERTRLLPPRLASDVELDGSTVRIDGPGIEAELTLGEAEDVEAVCPSGRRGYGWTRKRVGMEVSGSIRTGDGEVSVEGARGVDDESAGYHRRRLAWRWSAGVGTLADGRPAAWNLVAGINDPPRNSERAVWIGGSCYEPGPVSFDGLGAIDFDDGSRLSFESEAERRRSDRLLAVSSRYRQPFGSFRGALAGFELARGLGVMESHRVRW